MYEWESKYDVKKHQVKMLQGKIAFEIVRLATKFVTVNHPATSLLTPLLLSYMNAFTNHNLYICT